MLSKVYKELMILGFIAFAVILFKELEWIHWNTATLHCFEFCDLLVSICVLIYVGNTAMSSFTMHITQREWDRMSMTPTAAVIEDVNYYLDSLQTSGCRQCKHIMPFMATEWRAEADFKIMQLLFKTKFHMPAHFDYVMYIKAILEENVVSMANISTWHWVLIMLMNGGWWVGIVWGMPLVGMEATVDEDTCLLFCDPDGSSSDSHRRLSAAPESTTCSAKLLDFELHDDMCEYNLTQLDTAIDQLLNASGDPEGSYWFQCQACQDEMAGGAADITSEQTLLSLFAFAGMGWFVVLLQTLIVRNVNGRMQHILKLHGANKDDSINEMLTTLQEKLRDQNSRALAGFEDEDDGNYWLTHILMLEMMIFRRKSLGHQLYCYAKNELRTNRAPTPPELDFQG